MWEYGRMSQAIPGDLRIGDEDFSSFVGSCVSYIKISTGSLFSLKHLVHNVNL